jgi:predicted LPLAT superfamily acyltransferase
MQVPVIFFVDFMKVDNVHRIHFEKFSDPPVSRDRDLPNELVAAWVDRYAQFLERYCRLSPYNWFNFFDVWRH